MIALAALFAAPAIAPSTAPSEEIAVVGRKLAETHGAISLNPFAGKRKCKVTKSSGNTEIDSAVCEIALTCAKGRALRPGKFRDCVEGERRAFLLAYARKLQDQNAADH